MVPPGPLLVVGITLVVPPEPLPPLACEPAALAPALELCAGTVELPPELLEPAWPAELLATPEAEVPPALFPPAAVVPALAAPPESEPEQLASSHNANMPVDAFGIQVPGRLRFIMDRGVPILVFRVGSRPRSSRRLVRSAARLW